MYTSINSDKSKDEDLSVENLVGAQFYGLTEFQRSLDLQTEQIKKCENQNQSRILGFEYPTLMTLGLRAHEFNFNQLSIDWKYPIFKINRGGLATIHSPGQLVIYPIIDLKKNKISVRKFVEILFKTTQKTLNLYGVTSTMDLCAQPGLYTEFGKIAFCGLNVQKDITSFGISINLFNDLSLFNLIESCGTKSALIDSVKNYYVKKNIHDHELDLETYFKEWVLNFSLTVE